MRGSIAERGGVRVGHRIIEINGESVVATSHQHIVELLATTVGEVRDDMMLCVWCSRVTHVLSMSPNVPFECCPRAVVL